MTKYNPNRRDRNGNFIDDDWTSVSDIGKVFNGKILTVSDYLRTEQSYVDAIKNLLSAASIGSMRLIDIEMRRLKNHEYININDQVIEDCEQAQENKIVGGDVLANVIRGCLREYMWCRLAGGGGSYIHFGYDYYVYIGFQKFFTLPASPQGIFLERMISPYFDEDE